MPAFLLSSAPGNTLSFPGLQITTKHSDAAKTGTQSPDMAGSFSESLSATMASLGKLSQTDSAEKPVDLASLSASMEELSAQLEELDPALFDALRSFLNGQDLSINGLEDMQEGGTLPDFFAELQAKLGLEKDLTVLTEAELSALDSSIRQLSALINPAMTASPSDHALANEAQAPVVLSGMSFSINKDGRVELIRGASAEENRATSWQMPGTQMTSEEGDPVLPTQPASAQPGSATLAQAMAPESQVLSGTQVRTTAATEAQLQAQAQIQTQNGAQQTPAQSLSNLQAGQQQPAPTNAPVDPALSLQSFDVMTEADKSFNAHFEQMKSEISAEPMESILEKGLDVKEKPATVRFSDQQLRSLNDTFKPYSTTLMTPVDAKEWADEVSQKIVWFTGRNIQAAEMHLNPADLGPIDVKINVQNDVASVSFNVQNASVRELLESNVVRLREMMESNGVNLGDVNVDSGSQDAYEQARHAAQLAGSFGEQGSGDGVEDEALAEKLSVKSANLVDYFV